MRFCAATARSVLRGIPAQRHFVTLSPTLVILSLSKYKKNLRDRGILKTVPNYRNPGSSNGRTQASEACYWSSNLWPGATALSSRGLGRRPLTAVTRVRLPLGL